MFKWIFCLLGLVIQISGSTLNAINSLSSKFYRNRFDQIDQKWQLFKNILWFF